MAYTYDQTNVINLKHLKKAVARSQNEVTALAQLIVGTLEDLMLQVSLSVPTNAWGTNTDAATLAEGYRYKADVTISGLVDSANVTITLSTASLATAFTAGVYPNVVVNNGSLRLFSKDIPASALTGTVNIVQLAED